MIWELFQPIAQGFVDGLPIYIHIPTQPYDISIRLPHPNQHRHDRQRHDDKHHIPAPDAQQRRTGLAAFLGGVLPLFPPTGVPEPDKARLALQSFRKHRPSHSIYPMAHSTPSGSTSIFALGMSQYKAIAQTSVRIRFLVIFHMETALRSILLLLSVTRLLG